MTAKTTDFAPFEALRPQLIALLELHRSACTEEARAAIMTLFEQAFLATAWHVAHDLLENGWAPGFVDERERRGRGRMKVVGGTDAA